METRAILKRAGMWAGLALGCLALLALLAFGALQTPWARQFAARKAVEALAGAGVTAEVSPPRGVLPFRMRMDEVKLSDAHGQWLAARDVALAVDAAALAGRVISVGLDVAGLDLSRLPESPPDKGPKPPPSRPLSFLDTLSPIPVEAEARVRVGSFRLGATVAGRELAGSLSLEAVARGGAADARAGAELEGGGRADLSARYDPVNRFARLGLTAEEAPGGLLAGLAGLPAQRPLRVFVKGEGPFEAFEAAFEAQTDTVRDGAAARAGILSGTLRASLGRTSADDARFRLEAQADPAFLPIPPEARKAAGPRVDLRFEGLLTAAGLPAPQWKLLVEDLAVDTASASATVAGDSGVMARAPRLSYRVNARDPAALGVKAGPLAAEGELEADLDPDRPLKVALTLRSRDLAQILDPLGVGLSAGVDARATVAGDEQGKAYDATLEANLSGIAPGRGDLGPKLAGLLGGEASVHADARFMAGNKALVRRLEFTSAGLTARGSGSLDLDGGTGDFKATARAGDLSLFSRLAGVPLGGSADLDLEAGGPFAAPGPAPGQPLAVKASLRAAPLAVRDIRLDALTASVSARPDKGGLAGEFSSEARRGEGTLHAASGFALAGDHLTLKGLRARGPGLELDADLAASLAGRTATGQARLATDLGRLGAFLGRDMQGRARLEAKLAAQGERQDVQARLETSGLAVGDAKAAKAELDATLKDVLRAPSGDLSASLSQAEAAGAAVESLTLKARGAGREASFDLAAKGDFQGRFEATASGSFARAKDQGLGAGVLKLARLSGSARGVAVKLARPVSAAFEPGGFSLDGLALSVDKATLTASGRMRQGKADFTAQVASFPLAILEKFGQRPLDGTASASATVSGPVGAPRATASVKLDNVKDKALAGPGVPPLSLAADAEIAGGRLTAKATGSAGPEASFQARAALPARLSLAPFAFDIPQGGELDAALSGGVNLALADAFLGDEALRLKGILKADFTARGRIEAPTVSGTARMEGGEAAYLATGTRLRDLGLEIEATGTEVVLRRLSARGMRGGTLSATGKAGMAPGGDFPFEGRLVLDKLVPVRTEEVTATLSARIDASGSAKGARVSGAASIGPVQVNLPERMPPEATPIQVRKVNVPGQPRQARQGPPAVPAPPFPVELDVTADFPGRIFVRGMGLDSVWAGNLHVKGTAAEPTVEGAVRVVRGRLDFFGRNFTLERGVVTFQGSKPPAPMLDMEARTQSGDLTASILASGPVARPKIELASDPPLPRDEILARVLFGKGVATLTPPQAIQLAQAVASLTGSGEALDFLGKTRKVTGLDYLGLKTTGQEMNQSAVSAGKYVADGVYVEASQGLGTPGSSVSVEVDVTKNITVESKVGLDSKTGIGVNWKFDY